MQRGQKVIDIAAYREAVQARQAQGLSPLWVAGWAVSLASGVFGAYALYRSLEFGVFDSVVAAILAVNAVLFIAGMGLVRASGAIHSWLHTRSWNRLATTAGQDSDLPAPISIETARRVRSPFGSGAMITCSACGTAFGSDADACPACGRMSRAG